MFLLTMQYLFYSTTVFAVCCSLFYIYAKYKLSYWSRRGVKTPPTHLLFGNFKDSIMLKKSPGQLMHEIYNTADPDDPYIGFYIFHKPMLLLRDHDLIKQVMITDFDIFPNRRFGSAIEKDSLGLVNLLAIKQPRWKYLRGKLTPALTGQKLKKMMPLIIECRNSMFDFIESLPTNKFGWKELELKEISTCYSSDVFSSLAFGITTNSFNQKDTTMLKAGLNILRGFQRGIVLLIFFFMPEWCTLIEPFIKGPAKIFRETFLDSINNREKTGNKRGDLVDSLLALKHGEQNPDFKFEGDNLLAQAVSFYVAGFETNANSIAFTLFELARHPEHQVMLYDEIKTILSGKDLTIDLINEMSFLDCIVNESLRLYPPLPISDRIPIRDYKLSDSKLIIEKNTPIYVSINGTNQDPRYFSSPQDFLPLRIKTKDKRFYESLAFGIGSRSCIGQRMGLLITKMAIIEVVSNYILSYKEEKENILNPASVFTITVDGLLVQFKKRVKYV